MMSSDEEYIRKAANIHRVERMTKEAEQSVAAAEKSITVMAEYKTREPAALLAFNYATMSQEDLDGTLQALCATQYLVDELTHYTTEEYAEEGEVVPSELELLVMAKMYRAAGIDWVLVTA